LASIVGFVGASYAGGCGIDTAKSTSWDGSSDRSTLALSRSEGSKANGENGACELHDCCFRKSCVVKIAIFNDRIARFTAAPGPHEEMTQPIAEAWIAAEEALEHWQA